MNIKRFPRLLLAFCVGIGFGVLSQQTLAANNDGSIRGTVVDESKSSLAGSEIVIINEVNGYTRTISGNDQAGGQGVCA